MLIRTRERMVAVGAITLLWGILITHGESSVALHSPAQSQPGRKPGYVSDAACTTCHEAKAEAYHHSAHATTSALPSTESIKGNFAPGQNTMATADPAISFLMEKTDRGFFQTALVTTPDQTLKRKERIAVVIGSGRKGQTYLFWNRDQLFELPVSTWTKTGEWMNSPGYPDGTANFDRGVSARCLECHTTSFESVPPQRNRFRPDSLILGISCQKCHGPGADHVAQYSQAIPATVPGGIGIVNPSKLSRERQMDICSLCHAGVGKALAPTLSYVAGDSLDRFITIAPSNPDKQIDPHGSQVQTLTQSRCYQSSGTLTCITCHNTHSVQRQPSELATTCLSCHQTERCGKFRDLGHGIDAKCVDCHMPLETTDKIVLRINGKRYQPQVRNHRIGIYPQAETR